jgi:sigma-B regulation protein RsbU (phosphoserine phosphatase)
MTAPTNTIRALLIEDNPGDARLIQESLRDADPRGSVDLQRVDRLERGLGVLANDAIDVVLLDLSLPDSTGLETFTRLHEAFPAVAAVVLSGLNDESVAVNAVQSGAQDYLVKGLVDGTALLRSMRYAVERQKLEAARRDLERQRDEFFSSVSHDLRTPVAAIKAAVGVVLANEPSDMPAVLHRLLGNIDGAADELAALIEDILEIARLQSGRVELWRSEVDLRHVIRRAIAALEPLFEARGQHVSTDFSSEDTHVSADAERIGRVLRNVLGNAQKYGADGGSIDVRLSRLPDGQMCVSVHDDGPGIPAGEEERIFERFYRVREAARSGPAGTGLGLAIARGLVELHGGKLWAESAAGQGSTFHMLLPALTP